MERGSASDVVVQSGDDHTVKSFLVFSKQTDTKEPYKKGETSAKKERVGGVDGRPGKRSVDHTRPLPSSVNIAGLHVVTAGVTPRAESRSGLKETHPIGGGGGGEGGGEGFWRRRGRGGGAVFVEGRGVRPATVAMVTTSRCCCSRGREREEPGWSIA